MIKYLPPAQSRTGPYYNEFPFFKHNDVYDYISSSYSMLGDMTEALKFGRAFEATCPKGDSERERAKDNLDLLLGGESMRRIDPYEDTCSNTVSFAMQLAPALSVTSQFGSDDEAPAHQSYRMRVDNGQSIWATPISRPPGAANVTQLHSLLSEEECEHIMRIAKPELGHTTVVDPDTGEEKVDTYRTSKGTWLNFGTDPVVDKINIRLAALTHKGLKTHEQLHIVHYKEGELYEPHYDFSDPNRDKDDWTESEEAGNREISIIMFLKAPAAGGATVFPISRLSVEPRQGDAVMFYNLNKKGFVDHLTNHGGCPPTKDEKWIATKWIRSGNQPESEWPNVDMGYYA